MMDTAEKNRRLTALAKKRKATRWPGYNCIGDYHDGVYECDLVSPYTKSAGNVHADIFVLLQDWSSDGSLSGPFDEPSALLGHTPHLPTNRNLKRLLQETFDTDLGSVYATNLFPFIKLGGMSTRIPQRDLVRAATEFAIPQIQVVRPRLVICLGQVTYLAVRRACGLPAVRGMDACIGSPFDIEDSRVWCQAHTGSLGQNNRNRGGVDRVQIDWQRMKEDVSL